MPLLDCCTLGLGRWYPLPYRLVRFYRLKHSAKADIAHCRAVLDRVADRFDIPCAPLD